MALGSKGGKGAAGPGPGGKPGFNIGKGPAPYAPASPAKGAPGSGMLGSSYGKGKGTSNIPPSMVRGHEARQPPPPPASKGKGGKGPGKMGDMMAGFYGSADESPGGIRREVRAEQSVEQQ